MEKLEDWLPLEANPMVINKYMGELGADTTRYICYDVPSVDDDWALAAIPQPITAMLFLFPITENRIKYEREVDERIRNEGQIVSRDLFFMYQYAKNACGTIGILHALVNLWDQQPRVVKPDTYLASFIKRFRDLNDPERIGKELLNDRRLQLAHKEAVHTNVNGGSSQNLGKSDTDLSANETKPKPSGEESSAKKQEEENDADNLIKKVKSGHFVAFIHKDGYLYELDGRKDYPINHGPTSDFTLLMDSIPIVKKMMAINPEDDRFNTIVLAPSDFSS